MSDPTHGSRELAGWTRYFVAGCGGVSSLVPPLLISDYDTIASNLQIVFASDFSGLWLISAYLLRFSVFIGLAVFWVWAVNHAERNAWKLFQLGVIAPALLVGADQSWRLDRARESAEDVQQSSSLFISQAFAQEMKRGDDRSGYLAGRDLSRWEIFKSGLLMRPLDDPIGRLAQETTEAQQARAELEQELSTVRASAASAGDLQASLEAEIARLRSENLDLSEENQALQSENQALIDNVPQDVLRKGELEARVAELTSEVGSLEAEIDALNLQLETAKSKPQATIVGLWQIPKVQGSLGYGSVEARTFERGEDLDKAMSYYQGLASVAKDKEYLLGEAAAYADMAAVARLKGEEEDVAAYVKEQAEILRSIGQEEPTMISAYKGLGVTEELENSLEEAKEFHVQALELAQEQEFSWGIGAAYLNLGVVAYMAKSMEEAEASFDKALEGFGEEGVLGKAMTYKNLAVLYEATDREKLAAESEIAAENILQTLRE